MHSPRPAGEQPDHRHAAEVAALLQAALESPAVTDPATRAAVCQGESLPPPLGEYAAKVRDESYRISDEEVQALLAAGYSADAVFEVTVAAALGASMRQLAAGLRELREAH
jgi:hypothetical protein